MEASEQSLFWIDPHRLADLALSAAGGSPEGEASVARLRGRADGRAMTGVVTEVAAPRAPSSSPGASEATLPGEGIQDLDSSIPSPDFCPPAGALDQRFESLLDWLDGLEGCHSAFLVNHEGLALVNRGVSDKLLAVSSAVSELLDSLRAGVDLVLDGWLTLELAPDTRLHFLSAQSAWGLISVGFLARNLLSFEILSAVRRAFHRTVDDPTE